MAKLRALFGLPAWVPSKAIARVFAGSAICSWRPQPDALPAVPFETGVGMSK